MLDDRTTNLDATGRFIVNIILETALSLLGRAWPFLDDRTAGYLPDPKHIVGPTISMCTDVIKIELEETVESLLLRLDSEQHRITRYQHCPSSIVERMDEADRQVWARARKQIFNWLPFEYLQQREKNESALRLVDDRILKLDEPVDEFMWRCSLLDTWHLEIDVHASQEQFGVASLKDIVDKVNGLVHWLTDEQNRDKKVAAILASEACASGQDSMRVFLKDIQIVGEAGIVELMYKDACLCSSQKGTPIVPRANMIQLDGALRQYMNFL